MGLGSYHSVTLARAREKAADVRAKVADGVDPIPERKAKRAIPTFGELADEWIKKKSARVRGKKSVARYERALGKGGYAEPLRARQLDAISGEDVLAVLRPIWADRLTTAKTLRAYLFDVLDIAKARKLRTGENPAAWEGFLKAELELDGSNSDRKHHAAMPWRQVPKFVTDLRNAAGLGARALEFLILNASRTSEVLEMKVRELHLEDKARWIIPGERMKAARQHEIRLSHRSVEILRSIIPKNATPDDFVFGGQKPLSNMILAMILRRKGGAGFTVHGFRSSFRDWVNDATEYPRELAEMALAHAVGDATERAYLRGNAPERRARLMQDWSDFIDGKLKPVGHEDSERGTADTARIETATSLPSLSPPPAAGAVRRAPKRISAANAYQTNLGLEEPLVDRLRRRR